MSFSTPRIRIQYLILLLIFCTALLFRVEYIRKTTIHMPIRVDARQYVIYGYNLAAHGIFSVSPGDTPVPDSLRSPGYPVLLALCIKLAGKSGYYPLILNIQAFLGSLVPIFTYFLGKKYLPFWGSCAAAILVALSPHQVTIASYLLTETLFGFLLLASILWFAHAIETHKPIHAFGAAIAWGSTYMVNETVLFLPYLMALACLLIFKTKTRMFKSGIMIFLLIFTLFPASWFVRNSLVVPPGVSKGADRAIATISHGAYPDFIYKTSRYKYYPYREDPQQPEFGSSLSGFITVFSQRFQERPLRYLSWYFLEKPVYLWTWNILQGQGDVYIYEVVTSLFDQSILANAIKRVMKWLHPFILGFALIGMFILISRLYHGKKEDRLALMVFISISYYTLLFTVFAPWPRYSIPLRPELYLCCLWSVCQISGFRGLKKPLDTNPG